MASFKEQMDIHYASRMATSALESASRNSIAQIFAEWLAGLHSNISVRWRLEAVVRSAYRTSAAVARGVAQESSDLPDWQSHEVFNTAYLQELLEDVRRNLRDFKSGKLTSAQAIDRIQHSAGVAAQRGYTDQTIASYTELQDFGLKLQKYWVANFEDNTPCPACQRLHGTSVALKEPFQAETGEPGVYRDLLGPPRHPRCQCRLYIFTVSLENSFETPDFENPQDAPQMMTTEDVKKMPQGIYQAVRATLRAILKFLRGNK